jgi:hypothetical protein
MDFSAVFPTAIQQSLRNKTSLSKTSFSNFICLVRLFLNHLSYVYGCNGKLYDTHIFSWGIRWCSWLKHCPTSWKVACSISNWCHWNFSLTESFCPHHGLGVNSASDRNEYRNYFMGGKGGRFIGLTTIPPSYAYCVEIWEPSTSVNPQDLSMPIEGLLFYFLCFIMLHKYEKVMSQITPKKKGSTKSETRLLHVQ